MAGNIVLLSVILSVPYSCSLVIPFPWQAALMARYVVHKTGKKFSFIRLFNYYQIKSVVHSCLVII